MPKLRDIGFALDVFYYDFFYADDGKESECQTLGTQEMNSNFHRDGRWRRENWEKE